ncbi:GNAT family N-acetyltransferase [Photobacterium sp. OFAV2-7]|uniref:GNAT family N-acetyltransferase n=1 Tax=Photobacterium sp. OFAV2-7 TaxID=2917748 RepID=UPI001EF4A21E|nr:GNAT family N-acetyltransferase [Photobacterium sp. OFAV2-7]MCG7585720.1 GNAT family N-acetyltransferase [Photobacterium sp. OFAV2-7]
MQNQDKYQLLKQGHSCALNDTLSVRLIQQSDFDDIVEMLGNPAVNQYLYFAPSPVEVYEVFFTPIIENTRQAIANKEWPDSPTLVIRDAEGTYMGMLGITPVMMLAGNFEVGHQLPEHAWGQGIGTLGCQFATTLAFEQLGAHKVCADCYAGNFGSVRVLEKTGFILEGRQQDYYRLENGFDDRLWFGITLDQFKVQYPKRHQG